MQAVADRSGFLVEDRLNILLAPYTRSQNTLVRIDNVFNVSISVHVNHGFFKVINSTILLYLLPKYSSIFITILFDLYLA